MPVGDPSIPVFENPTPTVGLNLPGCGHCRSTSTRLCAGPVPDGIPNGYWFFADGPAILWLRCLDCRRLTRLVPTNYFGDDRTDLERDDNWEAVDHV